MSTLSSTGIGSGLDVQRIVQQLGQTQRSAIAPMQAAATRTQTQLSALSQIRNSFSELEKSMRNLNTPITASTSSNNTTINATTNAQAIIPRGFDVEVIGIAKAQAMASAAMFPMGAGWGAGNLRLQMGQWSVVPPGFTPATGLTVDVAISMSDTTTDIAAKINNSQSSIQASVLRDTQGERLVLRSAEMGVSNGFSISIIGNEGLSRLFSQGAGSIKQFAQNGEARVNGVPISTNTNQFTIDGTNIDFGGSSSGSRAHINTTSNKDEMRTRLDNMVQAFNNVQQLLQTSTRFDAATRTAGPLQGNNIMSGLGQRMRQMMADAINSSNGVFSLNATGRIVVTEPADISSNWDNINTVFSPSTQLGSFVSQINAIGGAFDIKTQTYNNILERNRQSQERIEERAKRFEAASLRQFQQLDSQLARMQALSSYWNRF